MAWRGLAIARHEVRRLVGGLGRKGLLGFALLVVLLGVAWPVVQGHGIHPTSSLFTAAASPDSPYRAAAASATEFRVIDGSPGDLSSGRADLWLGNDVQAAATQRGQAALRAFTDDLQAWLDEQMRHEGNQSAAFPLVVTLLDAPQAGGQTLVLQPNHGPLPAPSGNPSGQPPITGLVGNATVRSGLRPADVEPTLPTASLVLTFAYLLPMNLVAQATGASMLTDRFRHRTTLLLSTPHGAGRILLHRLLPVFALSLLMWLVATIAIRTSLAGAIAALPIIAVPVLAGAVLGLCVRSERELTFLLTAVTTMLSTFLFLPAFFGAIPAIAALSPVTVIAAGIRGDPVSWSTFATATVPLTFLAVGLAATARALHHEEAMSSIHGPLRQIVRAMARLVRGPTSILIAGILAVPFALVVEILWLAFLIPLGFAAAIPLVVFGAAFIEELAKLAVTRAWAQRGGGHPAWAGVLAGTGFFIGEKAALLLALTGLGGVPLGPSGLAILGVGSLAALLGPLLLHPTAAATAAVLAEKRGLRTGLWTATLMHAAYNVAILAVVR